MVRGYGSLHNTRKELFTSSVSYLSGYLFQRNTQTVVLILPSAIAPGVRKQITLVP